MISETLLKFTQPKITRSNFCAVVVGFTILLSACRDIQKPKIEPFYAVTVPPRAQELLWSNGKMPKSLDPARAAAAPETDVIRAAYDGLTDLDSKSLNEIPGVAEKWESAADHRTWTFHLRKDALWSNGERVTAGDFVRSWKRLADLKEKAANSYLFQNIIGLRAKDPAVEKSAAEPGDFLHQPQPEGTSPLPMPHGEPQGLPRSQLSATPEKEQKKQPETKPEDLKSAKHLPEPPKFGVEAIDDLTLKVSLDLPDKDFPKLVANPIFRPVYGDGADFNNPQMDPDTVTNGAFEITNIGDDGISLEKSDTFWNRKSVALERVKFVASASAESALDAYKKGEVDVLTNASFEPLALKILTPYEDFRQTAHSALNFYEFNAAKAPFSDRRVREALAISIDRQKLTEGDLEGTTQPAFTFFPLGEKEDQVLSLDVDKAKQLLQKAGFPGGTGFPPIRLVINRNDQQQRVARSVMRMWKQNLNLDTIITVKETSEIEDVHKSGDFDVLRRGVVLPVNDELVNLASILGSTKKMVEKPAGETKTGETPLPEKQPSLFPGEVTKGGPLTMPNDVPPAANPEPVMTISEAGAIYELKSMPLYFPMSYSLVKPYVRGFEMNGLDAPSLKEMSIDSNWQPKPGQGGS